MYCKFETEICTDSLNVPIQKQNNNNIMFLSAFNRPTIVFYFKLLTKITFLVDWFAAQYQA